MFTNTMTLDPLYNLQYRAHQVDLKWIFEGQRHKRYGGIVQPSGSDAVGSPRGLPKPLNMFSGHLVRCQNSDPCLGPHYSVVPDRLGTQKRLYFLSNQHKNMCQLQSILADATRHVIGLPLP